MDQPRSSDALEDLGPILARRPIEAAISEGNLAENPIFVLSHHDARPDAIQRDSDGKLTYAEYTRIIYISKDLVHGRSVERSVTLKANPQFGFPTMFGYRLLLAIIEEAKKNDFKSPRVYISRNELASRLGYKRPSKLVYQDIENALGAMRTLTVQFKDAWYDKRAGQRGNIDCDGLIGRFRFVDDRQVALPFPGMNDNEDVKRSYVTLGEVLFESLKSNYFHGIDLDYMNGLRTPLAQRLYAYLSKKDNNKHSYTEDIRLLASKLNLKKRAPSAIWDALDPQGDGERIRERQKNGPLALLSMPMQLNGETKPRRFLERWVSDRQKNQLTVFFYNDVEKEIEASFAQAKLKKTQEAWR